VATSVQAMTMAGELRAIPAAVIDDLRAVLRGALLQAGDPGYDEARLVWNGMIDRHPALIAQCAGTADVSRAIQFARSYDLLIAVRGGGHSFPGHSTCDGGLVIDLSPMRRIEVDSQARRARAGGGVRWGELDRATQEHGLAVTGGQVSHTGIAGLTLGGGMGWLMREHGLTVDNLLSADVVSADGAQLRASAEENPDLFWALRGGGGNFGIVTGFEYRLHPVGPMLYGGLIGYPLAEAVRIFRDAADYLATAPEALSATLALLHSPEGHPLAGVVACYTGDPASAEPVVAPLRRLSTPIMEQLGPMPYVAVQQMIDQVAAPGLRYYMRSNLLDTLDEEMIGIAAEHFARCPSPQSLVIFVQMGGTIARVAPEATAFPHRWAAYSFTTLAIWEDPKADEENIAWVRALWGDLRPKLPNAVYVNELTGDEGTARLRAAYGPAYERLAALKRRYDPANVFRLNQNIAPPA